MPNWRLPDCNPVAATFRPISRVTTCYVVGAIVCPGSPLELSRIWQFLEGVNFAFGPDRLRVVSFGVAVWCRMDPERLLPVVSW